MADPSGPAPRGAAVPPQTARTTERAGDSGAKPTVENRWWVDTTGGKKRPAAAPADAPGEPVERPMPRVAGERLFRVGRDFDQERARAHLGDGNLAWLREGNPSEGGWAYVAPGDERSRDDFVQHVKQMVRLPRGARAVLVDSGISVRVIVTGAPIGERIVELTLGAESSFDAWVRGDWVCEHVYRGRERALREASRLIARYLAPGD